MMPGFSYWGGYGRYVGVPNADTNLVPMPDDVGFEEGASMGCRFMTSYHGVVDRAQVRPGEWVAVHGCGGIGLSAIHVAAAIGANVIAVDLDDAKLELAKKIGAQHVVNGKKTDAVMAIMDITKGGAHVGVDAPRGQGDLSELDPVPAEAGPLAADWSDHCRRKGRSLRLPIDRMVTMELSAHRVARDAGDRYPSMLQMVNAKKLNPKSMITETISLDGASGCWSR